VMKQIVAMLLVCSAIQPSSHHKPQLTGVAERSTRNSTRLRGAWATWENSSTPSPPD